MSSGIGINACMPCARTRRRVLRTVIEDPYYVRKHGGDFHAEIRAAAAALISLALRDITNVCIDLVVWKAELFDWSISAN